MTTSPSWQALPDSNGVYEQRLGSNATGKYKWRGRINGKWTNRRLKDSHSRREAIGEANKRTWIVVTDLFSQLAAAWQAAGCPGRKGLPKNTRQAELSLPWLLKHFGKMRADEIRLKHLPDYQRFRARSIKRGKKNRFGQRGGRTVDLDLVTLSNILHFGVRQGGLELNYIYRARERYQGTTRHAGAVMPENAEIIHAIAAHFFGRVRSEVMAWIAFFSEFTGNRHSELLRLDLNHHATPNQPGYIKWFSSAAIADRTDGVIGQLHLGERSKGGVNPWGAIVPEFGEMLRAFLHWHRRRFGLGEPGQPRWFFPGHIRGTHLAPEAFGKALRRASQELGFPHITPHGFRAYFATKHSRDGKRSNEIAYNMGDRSVAMVEKVYINNPTGEKLWWTPPDGLPAWSHWNPPAIERMTQTMTQPKKHQNQKPKKS